MLSEALATVERLKASPGGELEQEATISTLAGACYEAQGDQHAAEREYLRAIQKWDSLHRIEDAVSVRSNLGVLYLDVGRLDDAIATLERAHSLLASSSDIPAFYRLVLTNNLAVAYSGKGDTAGAVLYARAALRLAESSKVGRYQLTASVYSNGADVLRSAGHRKEANEWARRALRAEAMANTLVDFSVLGGGRTRPQSSHVCGTCWLATGRRPAGPRRSGFRGTLAAGPE
jgi:tetratricopeptide (TPR) repeat protein